MEGSTIGICYRRNSVKSGSVRAGFNCTLFTSSLTYFVHSLMAHGMVETYKCMFSHSKPNKWEKSHFFAVTKTRPQFNVQIFALAAVLLLIGGTLFGLFLGRELTSPLEKRFKYWLASIVSRQGSFWDHFLGNS